MPKGQQFNAYMDGKDVWFLSHVLETLTSEIS